MEKFRGTHPQFAVFRVNPRTFIKITRLLETFLFLQLDSHTSVPRRGRSRRVTVPIVSRSKQSENGDHFDFHGGITRRRKSDKQQQQRRVGEGDGGRSNLSGRSIHLQSPPPHASILSFPGASLSLSLILHEILIQFHHLS